MSEIPRFSPQTENALRAAGWYPGRVVEQAVVETWYALTWGLGGGYVYPFSTALKMLREFGGLEISPAGASTAKNIIFNPIGAASEFDAPSWASYEWRLNDRLFPIGITKDYLLTFFIGLRGCVYAHDSVSGYFCLLGEAPEQGIESMTLGGNWRWFGLAEKDQNAEAIFDAVYQLCWPKPEGKSDIENGT